MPVRKLIPARGQLKLTGQPTTGQNVRATPTNMYSLATPYDKVIAQATKSLAAWTPKAMRQSAAQQAAAQIAPLITASQASGRAEQAQLEALQNRAAGFATALSSYGPQEQQQANQQYQQAAAALAGLGTGLTGDVAAHWQQAADTAAAQTAQQTGGLGQVGGYDIGGLRSTAQLTDVAMPAATLGAQAVAAGQQAAGREGAAGAQQNWITQDYLQKAADAARQREAEQTGIRAQRPQVFQEALTGQREQGKQAQQWLGTLAGLRQGAQQAQISATQAQTQLGQGQQTIGLDRRRLDQNARQIANTIWESHKRIGMSQQQINNQVSQFGKQYGLDAEQVGIMKGELQTKQTDARFQRWLEQQKLGITRDLAGNTIWQTAMEYTKLDPKTGQPIGGFTRDPKTGAVVDVNTLYSWWQNAANNTERWKETVASNTAAQTRAETSAAVSTASAQTRARQQYNTVDPTLSDRYHILTNQYGLPIIRGGKTVAYPGKGGPAGGYRPLTSGQRQGAIGKANSAAQTAAAGFNEQSPGWDPATDQPMEPMGLLDAKTMMERQGYFATPEMSKIAFQALRDAYKPIFAKGQAVTGLADLGEQFKSELAKWFGVGSGAGPTGTTGPKKAKKK